MSFTFLNRKYLITVKERFTRSYSQFDHEQLVELTDELMEMPEPFGEVIDRSKSKMLYDVLKLIPQTENHNYTPLKYLIMFDEIANMSYNPPLIHIGGWATYFIKSTVAGELINDWRGSHDLDSMDPTSAGVGVLSNLLVKDMVLSRRTSTSIAEKWAVFLGHEELKEYIEWDIYYPNEERAINIEGTKIPVEDIMEYSCRFGNVHFLNPLYMIALKSKAGRERDISDINDILESLEKVGLKEISEEVRKEIEI